VADVTEGPTAPGAVKRWIGHPGVMARDTRYDKFCFVTTEIFFTVFNT